MVIDKLVNAIQATFSQWNTPIKLSIQFDERGLQGLQVLWSQHLRGLGLFREQLSFPENIRDVIEEINGWIKTLDIYLRKDYTMQYQDEKQRVADQINADMKHGNREDAVRRAANFAIEASKQFSPEDLALGTKNMLGDVLKEANHFKLSDDAIKKVNEPTGRLKTQR